MTGQPGEFGAILLYAFVALVVVFLPTIAAIYNGSRNWFFILIANFFMPFTFFGWFALLFMATRRR